MGSQLYSDVAFYVSGNPSTGSLTVGTRLQGSRLPAEASIPDGTQVDYTIISALSGAFDRESGRGTISGSGATLSRDTVTASVIAGVAGATKMNVAAGAIVMLTVLAETLNKFVRTDLAQTFSAAEQAQVRESLGIGSVNRVAVGDAAHVITASESVIALTAALSAPRTWTLPATNTVPAGQRITIIDEAGGISGTNSLTIERAGSDTISGAASVVLANPYDSLTLTSDGASRWTMGVLGIEQGGTGARTVQGALAALGVGSRRDGRRNRLVNPAMQISQENGNNAGTTDGYYPADQWVLRLNAPGAGVSVQRVQVTTPGGSANRLRLSVTSAKITLAAGDYCYLEQRIEGKTICDARFGTADARSLVVRSGIKFPIGTYGLSVSNPAGTRAWVGQLVVSANSDEIKSMTISGETTGAWPTDNEAGLIFRICVAAGANFYGNAGWNASACLTTSAQTNGLASTANVFEIYDQGLYVDVDGYGIPPAWEMPDYRSTMRECQDYYRVHSINAGTQYIGVAGFGNATAILIIRRDAMRSSPILAVSTLSNWQYYATSNTWVNVPANTTNVLIYNIDQETIAIGIVVDAAGVVRLLRNTAGAIITENARL